MVPMFLPRLRWVDYTVVMKAEGFQEYRQSEVEVQIGHVVLVNASLELGTLAQVITAEARLPWWRLRTPKWALWCLTARWCNCPERARHLPIAPVAAGRAVATGFRPVLWQRPGRLGFGEWRPGTRQQFTVNGGNANDQFANLPAIQPSPDSIEEFRVMTARFDAEFGRNSGSVCERRHQVRAATRYTAMFMSSLRNQHLNARKLFEGPRPDSNRTSLAAR